MLRVTVERVGPDGGGTTIGHAVIGRWAGGHIVGLVDDRHPPRVGAVSGHEPQDDVWMLIRDAVSSCIADDADLTVGQLATLERQLTGGSRPR